jgi:signal transduction histidine kinase
MTRSWVAPVAVALVGLGVGAGEAAAGGIGLSDALQMLGYSAAGAAGVGGVAIVVLRALHGRSFTVQFAVAVLAPVAAVAVGALWAAREMFLTGHDLVTLGVDLAAASSVAVIIALILGRRVAGSSTALAGMVRRLAHPSTVTVGPHPVQGPGELMALARELEDTSARLDEARAQADAVERSRRELVAWVSHDLRTPLAGIRAMIEAIEDGVVSDSVTVARYHATIRLETDRLAGLVNDLFDLSRIQAGALRLDTERVPLDELIADAVDAGRAAADSVELVTTSGHPVPVVEVSAPEILRVVRNLVDNAVRHTPAGGRVVVEAGGDGVGGWVSVSDGCGGIPEADLPRVFDTGFRGDTARVPGDGHGGLGLTIARGLVEAHNGRIEVRNVGPGCRFTIHLPNVGHFRHLEPHHTRPPGPPVTGLPASLPRFRRSQSSDR